MQKLVLTLFSIMFTIHFIQSKYDGSDESDEPGIVDGYETIKNIDVCQVKLNTFLRKESKKLLIETDYTTTKCETELVQGENFRLTLKDNDDNVCEIIIYQNLKNELSLNTNKSSKEVELCVLVFDSVLD